MQDLWVSLLFLRRCSHSGRARTEPSRRIAHRQGLGAPPVAAQATCGEHNLLNPVGLDILNDGKASPYPSVIDAVGLPGTVQSVRVHLIDFTHPSADDVDILLVGPTGRKLLLMSDIGGEESQANNIDLTFSDAAQQPRCQPRGRSPVARSNRPTTATPALTSSAGRPKPPYAAMLQQFNGTSPNGEWKLFVVDDSIQFGGSIGGWSLSINVACAPCFGAEATISGSAASETINGTPGPDRILGLGGSDTIIGGGGNDKICAGPGPDLVTGGVGNDTVGGGDGNDALNGNAGNDTLRGGNNNDMINGGAGADTCFGDAGADTFSNCDGNVTQRLEEGDVVLP